MISRTSLKFGAHRQRSSTDTMVLVCSMISQDHVTKVSSNIGMSVSKLVTMLPTLVVTDIVVVEI